MKIKAIAWTANPATKSVFRGIQIELESGTSLIVRDNGAVQFPEDIRGMRFRVEVSDGDYSQGMNVAKAHVKQWLKDESNNSRD